MNRRIIIFIASFASVSVFVFYSQNYDIRDFYTKIKFPERNQSMKYILYWTWMFESPDFYLGYGSEIFQNCSYKNCYTTSDRYYIPINQYDAIMFHGREYKQFLHGKPQKRSPHQMYIFVNLESPDNSLQSIKNYNDFYNWTMTYRTDSDIFRPYASVREQKTDYQLPSVKDIEKRPKKIAWMVSDCDVTSKRDKLAQRIQQYMPVDIYGKCGELDCPKSSMGDCYKMLEVNYKFYLSFENSICEDYVTEKLYNVLRLNLVPIVYGGAEYEKFAPPGSYINVSNFTSVEALVEYLKYLDTHTEEYLNFFKWKKDYVIDTSGKSNPCNLCQKLNKPIESKVYSDIYEWWYGKKKKKCFNEVIVKKLQLD